MQSLRPSILTGVQQAASQKRGIADEVVHKGERIQMACLFKFRRPLRPQPAAKRGSPKEAEGKDGCPQTLSETLASRRIHDDAHGQHKRGPGKCCKRNAV